MLESTAEKIFLAHVKIKRNIGKTFAETQLVDVTFVTLLLHFLQDSIHTVQQSVVRPVCIKAHDEVATVYGGMSGVASGEHIKHNVLRTIYACRVTHTDISYHSFQTVR